MDLPRILNILCINTSFTWTFKKGDTFTNRNPKTGENEMNKPTISVDLHTYDDVNAIIEDQVNNKRPWHHPMGVDGYGQDISIRHLLHITYDTMKRLRMSVEFAEVVEEWIFEKPEEREKYRHKLIANVQKNVAARTITVKLNVPEGYKVGGEATISESEIDEENKKVLVIIEYPIIEHVPIERFRSNQNEGKEVEELRKRIEELEKLEEKNKSLESV